VSEPLTQDEFQIPPANFGDGWLTESAQDLCRIVIALGGFQPDEIVLAVTKVQGKREAKANVATVLKALQMVYEAHETPEEKAARAAASAALKARIHGQAG
jgi:hypothetical protein